MSTWWRRCRVCGEPGDDVRYCAQCGAFAPYGTQSGPDSDWRLLFGMALLMGLGLVLVITLGVLVLHVTGGR